VYLPFAQHPGRGLSVVVRSTVPIAQLQRALGERLSELLEITAPVVKPLNALVTGSIATSLQPAAGVYVRVDCARARH
jgi:hypothetical protein